MDQTVTPSAHIVHMGMNASLGVTAVLQTDHVNGCIQSSAGQIPYCSLFMFHRIV